MRRITALLFLGIYFLAATEVSQLGKLPELAKHYAEHKQLNQSLTFPQFLYMHYVNDYATDNDVAKDMKLPFKSGSMCIGFVSVDLICMGSCMLIQHPSFEPPRNLFVHEQEDLPNSYPESIWQPPRLSC